jgi:hypothetical protein
MRAIFSSSEVDWPGKRKGSETGLSSRLSAQILQSHVIQHIGDGRRRFLPEATGRADPSPGTPFLAARRHAVDQRNGPLYGPDNLADGDF